MSDWIVVGILGFAFIAMYLLGWLSSELFGKRREVKKIMATLDEILDVVTQTSGTADSIVPLITGLKQQIADLIAATGTLPPEFQAKVDAIFDAAIANKAKLDTAVNA
jgi:uncharacterized protein YukE